MLVYWTVGQGGQNRYRNSSYEHESELNVTASALTDGAILLLN
jgi:hypothetical protein